MSKVPSVRKALKQLAQLSREPLPADRVAMSGQLPPDLQAQEANTLTLSSAGKRQLGELGVLLAEDERYEYLSKREIEHALWRFACLSALKSPGDLIADFVATHERKPEWRTCFFPLEMLTVNGEYDMLGVKFLPADEVRPELLMSPSGFVRADSVVAVECSGTDQRKMSQRAHAVAERAVRVLRSTLRSNNWVPDEQLRFSLGPVYWFDPDLGSGGTAASGQRWELELDDVMLAKARTQQVFHLPTVAQTDVEKRAELALRWTDRALLIDDPTIELLYLFFALEALLGNKAEGLKGHRLALRRAILGSEASVGFAHPSIAFFLYDKVRSAAVHGEDAPAVSAKDLMHFAWDVRRAINEFLKFAADRNLVKRSKVRAALDGSPKRQGILDRLAEDQPQIWATYAAKENRQPSSS